MTRQEFWVNTNIMSSFQYMLQSNRNGKEIEEIKKKIRILTDLEF